MNLTKTSVCLSKHYGSMCHKSLGHGGNKTIRILRSTGTDTFKLSPSVKLLFKERRRLRTNRTNLGAFSLKSTGDYRKGQFKRTNTPANKQESKQTRKEARLRFPDTPALRLMNMCT